MQKTKCLAGFLVAAAALVFVPFSACSGAVGTEGIRPVPLADVVISDGFWATRLETNRRVTIPYIFRQCERTGRLDNFAGAGGLANGGFEGLFFNDSDVYKIIEAAAYSLRTCPDPNLEAYVDGVIDKIAAAQWRDGYLYTYYSLPARQPEKRWTNFKEMHELYCAGHLFEAAAAYYQTTGKLKLLDVALRLADHIDSVFGPDKRVGVPGHEEIEIGLVKLYDVTGAKKYLDMAKFFIDQRGRANGRELYGKYCQDHLPVIKQHEALGHAVRATYLYSGMADAARRMQAPGYANALDRLWLNVVSKKLYITGGIGSWPGGESFGRNYELPNRTAYCESCAAVGNALWNERMFLLQGDAKYIDVLERIIYNGLLSGVSLSGEKFFYRNPLESNGKYAFNNGITTRRKWFECACCPPNIARFMASLGEYVYAQDDDTIYVNLFVGSTAVVNVKGTAVILRQKTGYPWSGDVEISVEPERPVEFSIHLRIPGWLRNRPVPSNLYRYLRRTSSQMNMSVANLSVGLQTKKGYARIQRQWNKGDVIKIHLPMPVCRVLSSDKVKANAGRVALERGPVVYCAEAVDNSAHALNIVLADDSELESEYRKDLLGGVTVLRGNAYGLYKGRQTGSPVLKKQPFLAIPYYAWSNRGVGEMAVWLARKAVAAQPATK